MFALPDDSSSALGCPEILFWVGIADEKGGAGAGAGGGDNRGKGRR